MKYSVIVELIPISSQVARIQLQEIAAAIRQVMPDSAKSMEEKLGHGGQRWFGALSQQLELLEDGGKWTERAQYTQLVAHASQTIEGFVKELTDHLSFLNRMEADAASSSCPTPRISLRYRKTSRLDTP
jgi:hypothetical protein